MTIASMNRALRAVAILSSGLGLSACGASWPAADGLGFATSSVFGAPSRAAYDHAITERVPATAAHVRLPQAAGRVLHVTRTVHGNGTSQRIVLAADSAARGENSVEVRVVTPGTFASGDAETHTVHANTRRAIAAQMRRTLPGVDMVWSNRQNANVHGSFGYAYGRAPGGVGCLYAWQLLDDRKPTGWGIFAARSSRPQLSLRVRLCRAGADEVMLVGLVRQLRVTADPATLTAVRAPRWGNGAADGQGALAYGDGGAGYVSQGPTVAAPAPARQQGAPVRSARTERKRKARRTARGESRKTRTVRDPALKAVRVPVPPAPMPATDAPVPPAAPVVPAAAPVGASAARSASVVRPVPLPPAATTLPAVQTDPEVPVPVAMSGALTVPPSGVSGSTRPAAASIIPLPE